MKNDKNTIEQLERTAAELRATLVRMSHESRASHLGSAMSCADIVVALYWKILGLSAENINSPDRNRFILSKGHAVSALYAALGHKGIIEKSLLKTYCRPGSDLEEHPGPNTLPGVEAATGSLGHGVSLGAGMALAGKIKGKDYYVYVLSSDGECNEGSVWEAALNAAAKDLNRLCVIIDFNKWQATGRSREITALDPLCEKWQSFGWHTLEIDGHDMGTLVEKLHMSNLHPDKPTAVIAHTVKGKGVSFMEDDNNWHYRIPGREDLEKALFELGGHHE